LFKSWGYSGIYRKRTSGKKDGCAIFVRDTRYYKLFLLNDTILRFSIVEHKKYQFNVIAEMKKEAKEDPSIYLTDNVGIIATLLDVKTNNKICIGTTHLFWDPDFSGIECLMCSLTTL
jgi:mRNA deadenylase 3'-5' endonuclease subunit Ccr4